MKANTIAFLTTSHLPFDDRIYYHMAKSLSKFYSLVIVATTQNIRESFENIEVVADDKSNSSKRDKIEYLLTALKDYNPQIIICSEPLTIIAAKKYIRAIDKRIKIIYDVTEWYPSKKNLDGKSIPIKYFIFFKLLIFNIFSSSFADGFIFGEYHKSLPYRFLYPFKKWVTISYYPDLNYINFKKATANLKSICLGFTGKINNEKGIKNVVEVAKCIKGKKPECEVKLKIVGWFANKKDEISFTQLRNETANIDIELIGKQDFMKFSEKLQDIDVFFDLRKIDFENNRCLPIKLFYYMACGRPVIYSDLEAIRREVDVSQFGYLVEPDDADIISDYVIHYMDCPEIFLRHGYRAREMAESTYNWHKIEPIFLNYIKLYQI